MSHPVLIVDDEESLRRVTQVRLQKAGYLVDVAASAEEAEEKLARRSFSLVLTDLRMPGASGLDLLRRIKADYPDIIVVVMTAYGSVDTAVEAMKAGAYDYLTKPIDGDALLLVIGRALEHVKMREEIQTLRNSLDQKYGFENIIGRSRALLYTLDVASRAAQSDSTVLLRGETGTGKELLAKAVHFSSRRKDGPFVAINCGAIPRELLESELFGHVKGAFTGAVNHKKGKVEAADGGTLFLDEIGEMPFELQVKLLRMIQEREIEKVGGTEAIKVDVRIIAATHRNLQAMVEDGTFREDLYYRLAVIPIELPPLRERTEDIPELVNHFFARAKQRLGRENLRFPHHLMPYFTNYRWPGNIRELENVIERMIVLARTDEVSLEDLPDCMRRATGPSAGSIPIDIPEEGISLEGVERELLLRALQKADWNQSKAARYLDISRKTLIYRMEKYGLSKP
ncbi:MAG: sigma-54 dependent transcriptional regulator [Bryobacteraceae bacterium]|nr:sigma-54 dependent transcriptional regulator [Bryobacteraceae bacterium]MDW8377141.1 sigma-54 dependent transcriptional regulator [Bryobacterales bacterium]